MSKLSQIEVESFKVKRNSVNKWDKEYQIEFKQMYDRLTLVAMGVFEWENLPLSVDPVFLERNLLRYGSLVFFKDEDMIYNETETPYWVLTFMPSIQRDIYGDPIIRRAYTNYAKNYRKNLTYADSVIIYDNVLKMNMDELVYSFAKHLTLINNIKTRNLEQQRTPYIIGAVKEIEREVQDFMEQVNSGKPYFIVDESKAVDLMNALKVYGTNVEFIVNELQDYYDAVWNEFMTLVGVGNNASPKRERLVASEVDSVNEQAQAFANARLKSRQRACEVINEMYGLDIKVRFNFDKDESKEVEEIGTIHNDLNDSN